MTLFELQEWLGHSTPTATQHYAKITPLKVAKSYADAGYFARNLRAIEVLVDQDMVRSGRATTEPWKFYDLGHGYCTYDFFDQCQHRMACAKCDFYMTKGSSAALLLEGKMHLLRLLQEIPLGEAEQAAVEDGVAATKTFYRSYRTCRRLQAQRRVSSAPGWSRSHLFGRPCQLRPSRTREVTALEVESQINSRNSRRVRTAP